MIVHKRVILFLWSEAMVQNDENACQNMNSPTVGVTLDSIIEKCLDEDIANQCRSEIKALGKAVEYYVQHTVARNETATRCEREKRCHLESQLKDAFNILDNVRGTVAVILSSVFDKYLMSIS